MAVGSVLGQRLKQQRKQQRVHEIDAVLDDHDLSEDEVAELADDIEEMVEDGAGMLEYAIQASIAVVGAIVMYLGSIVRGMTVANAGAVSYIVYGIGMFFVGLSGYSLRRSMKANRKLELLRRQPRTLLE